MDQRSKVASYPSDLDFAVSSVDSAVMAASVAATVAAAMIATATVPSSPDLLSTASAFQPSLSKNLVKHSDRVGQCGIGFGPGRNCAC